MERMKTMLGVTEACHGEYECTTCNRFWHSCRAWKDYGQECKSCAKNIKPSKLEQLFPYCCPFCGCQWKDKMKENSKCKTCGSAAKMFMFASDRRKYIQGKNFRPNDEEVHLDNHETDLCERCQGLPYKDCRKRPPQDMKEGISLPQKIQKKKPVTPKKSSSPGISVGQSSPNCFPVGSGEVRKGFSYATVTKIYEPPNWTLPSSDEDQSSPDSDGKYASGASTTGNPDTSFDSGDFYRVDVDTRDNNSRSKSIDAPNWNLKQQMASEKAYAGYFSRQDPMISELHQRNKPFTQESPISDTYRRYQPGHGTSPASPVSGGVRDYCSIM